MWLFLLLPWLWSLGSASMATHLRVSTGGVFKVKCDMLPYRTYYDGVGCFFAVMAKLPYDRAETACKDVFVGARFYSEKYRERILQSMFLDASDYHDTLSTGQQKNVLCMMQIQYSCDFGDLALPGRCIMRSDGPVTWKEASSYCRSRGGSSVVIHNGQENKAFTDILQRGESGWLLPSRERIWSAEDEKIDYWKWFFESGNQGTPADLKCGDDSQHAVLANNAKSSCAAVGLWKVDHSTNKNIALCVKHADCPFCPPPPKRDDTETTVDPAIITTTPKPAPCLPLYDPPHQRDLWDLRYYFNFDRVLHGFAATNEGYNTMQANGIGYDSSKGAGSLGGTISDAGFARVREYCSDENELKHIQKMWFTKVGLAYQHVFGSPGEIYVGYVSRKAGACGSNLPMRRWSCSLSADIMYAGNLNTNQVDHTHYRGREQDGGAVYFWLWDMDETARNEQRKGKPTSCAQSPPANAPCLPLYDPPLQKDLWTLRFYFNYGRVVHGFAATTEGYHKMQSNGIGYEVSKGAGVLGGTISDAGFARIKEYCSDENELKHIQKMWFTKAGLAYQHVFGSPGEIYVGYVSRKSGACGAKLPMKRWSCSQSADMMYAGNLDTDNVDHTHYRGRVQDGGAVHFWLWDMNEAARNEQRKGKPASCAQSPPANAPELPAVVCKPRSDPPRRGDLWDLRYYYNWGRILHGFAATTDGYNSIQRNGIGYDCCNGAGSLGGTLSDEGYKRLGEVCSDDEQRKQIVKMWFSKQGQAYQHVFEGSSASKDVYVGYVALKQGMCGSKWPVKRWSCMMSADMMYAGNLNGNTWYSGRQQDGGQVHFWLWEMNDAVREQQRTGKC